MNGVGQRPLYRDCQRTPLVRYHSIVSENHCRNERGALTVHAFKRQHFQLDSHRIHRTYVEGSFD
jgi:hypothetical protein